MVENVSRKVLFVALALLGSLALILIPDRPFQMGLDLQGGTRLVYRFDLDDLPDAEQGTGDPGEILNQVVSIIRNRVDPTGVREASIRREGLDRIVVELPGTPDLSGEQAFSALGEELEQANSISLQLDPDDPEEVADFPENGGTVQIGDEKIHYAKRRGTTLLELQRGFRATEPSAHAAGAAVELASDDAIKDLIENLGDLAVNLQAVPGDFSDMDTDLPTEREKLATWAEENPGAPLVAFNDVEEADGGPVRVTEDQPGLRWVVGKAAEEGDLRTELDRAVPLLVQPDPDLRFSGADLAAVYPAQDRSGFPAVGFEMQPDRKGDFGELTGENVDRLMVITLNGVAESIATINERLPGQGIIQGRFSPAEVNELITVIRSGSLPIRPVLENEEVVGPTLGADYVRRGWVSGLIALIAVMVFMGVYYRRLGLFSSIALISSLLMLLGGLAFLRATITLPGIAGVILTVGMAVDANILIFDRVREELDKGQNVKQAAKTGFEKAFSAILDANLTTLITALVLYKIGTGPVRGFAVTLSIGIVASMIAALIITRLLVHFSLERGVKRFPMGRLMVTADYRFLNKAKYCLAGSAVAILVGVVAFAARPSGDKFGIDFLGGGEVQVRTEAPQDVDDVRAKVAEIPGAIGESAEVKPVLASAGEGGYSSFRITFKVTDVEQSGAGAEQSLKREIETHLAEILQKGPIELGEPTAEGGTDTWPVTLYFVDEHPVADAETALADRGLQEVSLAADAARPTVMSGTVASSGMSRSEVESVITNAYNLREDSNGVEFDLSQPIPSSSLVGPQVVGELRNKAVIALFVSLFAIVLYIRVRFAEYSYGVAAVCALSHDVLVTLGLLTLFDALGVINGELSLPMIAAFLTIIGYSLNDTIVIFDRVRENLPRMKKPLSEVLEISINQTLSRTVLTSGTTLIAVGILFAFNVGTGNTLEGFSFAMICGVLLGTYSTIFVANPVLLWLERRAAKKGHGARAHLEADRKRKKKDEGDDKAMATS